MGKKDPRVDTYIARQAAFAQPILNELRDIIHEADPGIDEDIKWGAPAFMHKGIVCIIAGFKAKVMVNFWKGALIVPSQARRASDEKGMGQLGELKTPGDLPPRKTIIGYVKAAIQLNEGGVPTPRRGKDAPAKKRAPMRTPPSLSKGLARNAKAKKTFENFSPSHKRDYIEWITQAKTPETRDRRIEQALGWMAEGKPRNWKYMRKSGNREQGTGNREQGTGNSADFLWVVDLVTKQPMHTHSRPRITDARRAAHTDLRLTGCRTRSLPVPTNISPHCPTTAARRSPRSGLSCEKICQRATRNS